MILSIKENMLEMRRKPKMRNEVRGESQTFRFPGEVVIVGGTADDGCESHGYAYHLRPVRL